MNIKFSEYKPSIPLTSLVQTYWTGDFNIYSEYQFVQSVIPNGCIELIIHLTTSHCELIKEDSWGKSPEFTLIGLQTSSYEVRFNEPVKVFGIRFHPEGIYNFFGVPPAHFTATFEDSKQVLGRDFDDYCSRLREAKTVKDQVALTESYLFKRLENMASGRLDYVKMASEIIRRNHGIISLECLMKQVPISPRQLQREFKNKLGITAKEYMRIARLNAIHTYFQSTPKINLTELSYEKGFADQSHFIREFKMMTGTNPKSFLNDRESYIVNTIDS